MSWYIYILLCDGKTYYVGLTHNLGQRLSSHKSKYNISTKEYSELKLVYYEQFKTMIEAEIRENQLKGWSIAKKKALIDGKITELIRLSKTLSESNR